MNQNKHISVLESNAHISEKVADLLEERSKHCIEKNGLVNIAISGGSLPAIVAIALARREIDFSKWRIYFADERCVPLDDKESNYMLVMSELIHKLPFSSKPVINHIDPALISEPAKCADAYAHVLHSNLPTLASGIPKLDICLLGIGPDGHTCSLFPGHELMAETRRFVAEITDSPKPPPARVTLTYPILNQSDLIIFIATGASKKEVLPYIVGQKASPLTQYPASLINCLETHFFFDKPAASEINY